MDNNYLYIIGVLGILLVVIVVFYYLKQKSYKTIESSKIQQHIQIDHMNEDNIVCDGDKCIIKQRQPKYDKCDDEIWFFKCNNILLAILITK